MFTFAQNSLKKLKNTFHKTFKTNTYWKNELQRHTKFKIGDYIIKIPDPSNASMPQSYRASSSSRCKIVDIDLVKDSGLYLKLSSSYYCLLDLETNTYFLEQISWLDRVYQLDVKTMSSVQFAKDLEEVIKG